MKRLDEMTKEELDALTDEDLNEIEKELTEKSKQILEKQEFKLPEIPKTSKPHTDEFDPHNLDLYDPVVCMDDVEEEEVEWLIDGFIPKDELCLLVGDGGCGKSFVWCALAAALSAGRPPFVLGKCDWIDGEKSLEKKILYFSGEDSEKKIFSKRLRWNGANKKNIFTVPRTEKLFKDIKFGTEYLENIVKKHKPDVLIFDPLQAFIPGNVKMIERNAMREVMECISQLCASLKITAIIVVHTNKRDNASGRNRVSDSSDIWDISRSIFMLGKTNEEDIRYMSHEKSNYGKYQQTVLYKIDDGVVKFVEYTDKKDFDFVHEKRRYSASPMKDLATDFIIDYLKNHGEVKSRELDEVAQAVGITIGTLKKAKGALRAKGLLKFRKVGISGKGKGVATYISYIDPLEKLTGKAPKQITIE